MRYNTLLFDLDGTLTDPFEGITRCVAYALEGQGITVTDRAELACYIGPPLQQAFEHFHGLDAAQSARALADYRERFADVGLYENVVYAGIPELLARLTASGRQLFVATSKPWAYARRIIAHFGLASYFGKVYGSEMDGQRAEKHALLAYIMRQQKLKPGETLMIGDRRFDILGARHNGMDAVAVGYGYGQPEELAAAEPLGVFESPTALGDYLLAPAPVSAPAETVTIR
ncbi:HAD hydrolase-like protein [Salinisphaera sp. Q1T1-3]|uniref:HAD hydrolase-like protein n=1 Tax=Salinisphaera sp. Q1T1-3 TaxID=2321229 RepID=UPI000E70E4B1|nr:HAD family hydrolase [Salinisphaera sp. Q1T1-3]